MQKNQTLSIPEEKLREILHKCQEILDFRWVSKTKFQSLLGSLMFIHKCVRPTRIFTNRLLQCLREAKDKRVYITEQVKQDVRWFLCFLRKFNGTTTFVHDLPFNAHTIAIDACLMSVGGIWDN